MTDSAGLERGYRRLLAWYPRPFRREREEEILTVLMASARDGQRRPRPIEAVDVIKSALWMRLRSGWPARPGQGWTDALAMFSLAGPLFLLAIDLLEVAWPYRMSNIGLFHAYGLPTGGHRQIGGLTLLGQRGFQIALGCHLLIAVLVLLGLRRIALAAIAGTAIYWFAGRYWIPAPLQQFSVSFYLLGAAALIASPGPRRGRHLVNWGHGVVLLMVALAIQLSTLRYIASTPLVRLASGPDTSAYPWASIALVVAAAGLVVMLKMNRYFPLLVLALCYPYLLLVAVPQTSSSNPVWHPTLVHLALRYLPLLLLAAGAVLMAVTPRRPRATASPA